MSSLKETVKNILDATEHDVINDLFHSEVSINTKWDSDEVTEFRAALQKSGITLEHVGNYGGEDQGSEYWSVYSFSKDNEVQYVKFEGYYASYDGSTFDEWYFAKPVPKSGFDYVKAE